MDPPPKYTWDQRSRRYRTSTGQYVSRREALRVRDGYVEGQKARSDALIDALVGRRLPLGRWLLDMKDLIKESHIAMYLWGKGGRNSMTQRDWGIVGRHLRDQYGFLRGFGEDLASGELSPEMARARARMYIEAATWQYERGRKEAWGLPDLPHYPADGSTRCLANCKCSLRFQERPEEWYVYWELNPTAETCPDCEQRSGEWSPYRVPKGV